MTGWELLLKNLGKNKADDEPITLMQIFEFNGIDDAIWALKCWDYKDYCLFLADVAESVLHIYEFKCGSAAPRLAIQGIRDYHAGRITKAELKDLAYAADAAAVTAAAYAAYAADAATAATYAATYAASYAANAGDADYNQATLIPLFIKHFGEEFDYVVVERGVSG